jgi:hypothetical protein
MVLIPGSKCPLDDGTTIVSIFTNTWVGTDSPQSTFGAFVQSTSSPLAVVLPDALTFDDISERYFGVFSQAIDPLRGVAPERSTPRQTAALLLAPSLPHIDPSSCDNYFVSDEPLDIVDMGTTTAPSASSRPLRPWLRNKLFPAAIRRRRGLEVRLRIFRWRGPRQRRDIHGHGCMRRADGRGERDQAALVALVGVARDGDAVWDDGDVGLGPWLERRLVVDLAARMETDHNKTTRLKAPSYSPCV